MKLAHKNQGTAFFILLAAIIASVVFLAGCGEGGVSPQKITVEGSGIGTSVPDEARVTVAVVTEGKTANDATTPNNQKTQAVIDALKAIGLEEKSLKTEAIDIQPKYSQDGTMKIVGFTASNRIRVTTKKLEMLGQIMETALAAGANTIDTLDMIATAQEKAKAAALGEAVKNARSKARVAAKEAGRKLGRVITIEEKSAIEPYPGYYEEMKGFAAHGGISAGVPVSPGQAEFHVQAKVVFELE